MFMTEEEIEKCQLKILGKEMSQNVLIHGFCGIFALVLHDKLKCRIRKLVDAYGLVHAYGIIENTPYSMLYLDARGWTQYEDVLLEEFHELCDIPVDDNFVGMSEYGYGYGRIEDLDGDAIDEFRYEIKESLTSEEYADVYKQSTAIIEKWNFQTDL